MAAQQFDITAANRTQTVYNKEAGEHKITESNVTHFYPTEADALAASNTNPSWLCFYPEG